MTNATIRATQPGRLAAGLLVTGFVCLWGAAPVAHADPVATCHSRHVDGVEEDVCVGNPDSPGGVNARDLYPGFVPELYFGVGIGLGF
ncbi:hypothetical protein BOO86_12060 [Mycobacterium sp. CBMA 234]|uniref:hypothetical protein n=1 Tax=Mycolicibacterium sp. CBMA 234 TaxID=1918495 RepID=UPI0012DF4C60|nr:hypothetical protein [Mycolicibacterium sp. CBMA 234]MUL65203.1 hypothetical protein [Mycolicibacterium sp. CBMA 234]